ncbi:MAG: hypothetical protein O7J95_06710 [Planctomycetota bacterium]|nr:hypothetical protein [Planctomycetota bacterium]
MRSVHRCQPTSASSRRQHRPAVNFWLTLALATPALAGDRLPPGRCPDHSLPFAEARAFDPLAEDVPPGVRDLRERNASSWVAFYDVVLDTGRFAAPAEPVSIVPPDLLAPALDEPRVKELARDFLHRNRAFFGGHRDELSPSVVRRIGRCLVVRFGQRTRDGLPVRGANVSLLLAEDGRLAFVKSYLVRDPSGATQETDGSSPLLSWEQVRPVVEEPGMEVVSWRLELGFISDSESRRPVAMWSVRLESPRGPAVEKNVHAVTGELLSSCLSLKTFEYHGTVSGFAAPLDDLTASPDRLVLGAPQGLGGIVLTDETGRVLGQSNETGFFTLACPELPAERQNPLTLFASLAHGPRIDTCPFPGMGLRCSEIFVEPWLVERDGTARRVGPELDANSDGIVDLVETRAAGGAPFDFRFNEGARRGEPSAEDQSFWLQAFDVTRRILESAKTIPALRQAVGGPGLHPLALQPVNSGVRQVFFVHNRTYNVITLTPNGACGGVRYPVVPSIIAHEIGHHVVHNVTGANRNTEVEEAAADVVAAFATRNPRIGYVGANDPGPVGFHLGETSACVGEVRAAVGGSLWNLFVAELERGSDGRTENLFYTWLASNEVIHPQELALDDPSCLLDEFLAINRLNANDPRLHIDENLILGAFDHPMFHRATRFVRGDANLDRSLNLSDPIATLVFLFGVPGEFHECQDAMDANDDGTVNLTDPIRVLNYLFLGGPAPGLPYPDCGLDATVDTLCCWETTGAACQRAGDPR